MTFLEFLVKKGVLNAEGSAEIERQSKASGEDTGELLKKAGLPATTLLDYHGEYYSVPVRHLEGVAVPYEILKYIPEESARHYNIVPLGVVEGVLEVGIVDPDNIQARDALQFISNKIGMPFKLFLIADTEIEGILKNYKNLSGEVSDALSGLATEPVGPESEGSGEQAEVGGGRAESATHIIEDAPVTKVVSVILQYAAEGNVSDVHIEHTGEKVRVRLRVDVECLVLHRALKLLCLRQCEGH